LTCSLKLEANKLENSVISRALTSWTPFPVFCEVLSRYLRWAHWVLVISPIFSLIEFQLLASVGTFCSATIQKVLFRGFSRFAGKRWRISDEFTWVSSTWINFSFLSEGNL